MAVLHRRSVAALALAAISVLVFGQGQSPPIKMGLWETTVNQTMTGLRIPPDVEARMKAMGRPMPGSTSATVQACYDEEQWRKNLGDLPSNQDRRCTRNNIVQDSRHMSMDLVCVDANGQPTVSGHMEMIFDSREQVHGTMAMKGTQAGRPGMPVNVETRVTSHFLSLDCGGLKPGDSKVISSQ
jgi:hypothetical protein